MLRRKSGKKSISHCRTSFFVMFGLVLKPYFCLTQVWLDGNFSNYPYTILLVVEKTKVNNVSPFTDKDFRIRCLADRVKDLSELCTLYPDVPKERAFGKYWSQSSDPVQEPNRLDYIPHTLSMTIPGYVSNVSNALRI